MIRALTPSIARMGLSQSNMCADGHMAEHYAKEKNMGRILYHYCSTESFKKIINNHTLRFADITKTNDSEELLFITEFYKQSLGYASESKWNSERYLFTESLKERSFYAFCVSDKEDDLSQWRGYAPNGGFAIGFDEDELKEFVEERVIIKNDETKMRKAMIGKGYSEKDVDEMFNNSKTNEEHGHFCEVIYLSLPNEGIDDPVSLALQKKMRQISSRFQELLSEGRPASHPAGDLFEECYKYKNKGFEVESESRLIFSQGKTTMADECFEDIVCIRDEQIKKEGDHYDIPFDLSMIKKIIIGPKVQFLGQRSGIPQMVLEFLQENDTYCGEDETRNLSITRDNIVLTKLSFR